MKIVYPINEGGPVRRTESEILAEYEQSTDIDPNRLQYMADDYVLWLPYVADDEELHGMIEAALDDLQTRSRRSKGLDERYLSLMRQVKRVRGFVYEHSQFDIEVTGGDPRLRGRHMSVGIHLKGLLKGRAADIAEALKGAPLGWADDEITVVNDGHIVNRLFDGYDGIGDDISEVVRDWIENIYGHAEIVLGEDPTGEYPDGASLIRLVAHPERCELEVWLRGGRRFRDTGDTPIRSVLPAIMEEVQADLGGSYLVSGVGWRGFTISDHDHVTADYDQVYEDLGRWALWARSTGLLPLHP